jgi:quercetin dioxygenase-like cupin family protein
MMVNKGFRVSMHYHKINEETFYLLSGKILFETESDGKKKKSIMVAGDIQHVKPDVWHRFTVLEDTDLFEFSTFHMNSDSYCKKFGEPIRWEKI